MVSLSFVPVYCSAPRQISFGHRLAIQYESRPLQYLSVPRCSLGRRLQQAISGTCRSNRHAMRAVGRVVGGMVWQIRYTILSVTIAASPDR